MTAYTRQIAEFTANLTLDAVPKHVIARAKQIILDGLGCGLYGVDLPSTEILARVIKQLEPQGGQATIWGRGEMASAVNATLVNGAMVQGYELDDGNPAGAIRSSAVLLPAVLAAAEYVGADKVSGERLLRAVVAGCEVGPRVGLCMNGEQMVKIGWHVPGIFAAFPAAVAAGVVLGLDSGRMFNALGIAGTQASGLMAAQSGSMMRCMQCAKGAQSGLYAALLAAEGFIGIENIFEEKSGGFCSTFSHGGGNVSLPALVDGLGERWETMSIGIKVYACAGGNQSAVGAIEELTEETGLKATDVEEITVGVPHNVVSHHGWSPYVPNGLASAQRHLGFCVAMQLIEGEVFVDQMVEENIARPDLVDLANRVKVVRSLEREQKGNDYRKGCDVEVRLKNGKVLKKTIDSLLGSDKRPLSSEQISTKFRRLAAKVLPQDKIANLHDAIGSLEMAPAVSSLISILGAQSHRAGLRARRDEESTQNGQAAT